MLEDTIVGDGPGEAERGGLAAGDAGDLILLRNIVESATSPICAFDHGFRLNAFNKAHNDEFGRVNGFDTKIGDVFPDLFVEEQRPVMRALMARALSGESFTVQNAVFGKEQIEAEMQVVTKPFDKAALGARIESMIAA